MESYLENGRPIKLEVEVVPPYLTFWGIIEGFSDGELFIKIEGQYAQGEIRKVKCIIPKDTKAWVFETFIIKGEGQFVVLKLPPIHQPELIQRRKYVRVPTNISVDCFLVGINNKKVQSQKSFPAVVKDLSGGGILVNCLFTLPIGTVFIFEIELNRKKIILTARVLRIRENTNDNTKNLGCEFVGISDGDRQIIIAYCSKMQLRKKN